MSLTDNTITTKTTHRVYAEGMKSHFFACSLFSFVSFRLQCNLHKISRQSPHEHSLIPSETYYVVQTDGHCSELAVFTPNNAKPGTSIVLIHPALGTPAGYYMKLAEALSSRNNLIVAVQELRGNGTSSWRASRKVDWTYWTCPSQDIPANIRTLRYLHPTGPLYLMGHSIGGIMISLYMCKLKVEESRRLDEIAGLLIIASGSLYYKSYPKPSIWWISWLVVCMAYLFGFFPGKMLNFGGKAEAKGLMLDWAQEIRTGNCVPTGCPYPNLVDAMKKIDKPVLLISFDKDAFVPHESAERLATFFSESRVTHLKVDPKDHEELKSLNKTALHFKWARGQTVLPMIETWLKPQLELHSNDAVTVHH
jgi:predicted alpha/beta hydrolase